MSEALGDDRKIPSGHVVWWCNEGSLKPEEAAAKGFSLSWVVPANCTVFLERDSESDPEPISYKKLKEEFSNVCLGDGSGQPKTSPLHFHPVATPAAMDFLNAASGSGFADLVCGFAS